MGQMINDFFEANQMLAPDFHLGSAPFGKSHFIRGRSPATEAGFPNPQIHTPPLEGTHT